MQGKFSREKGFFGGYSNRKWGLEYFGASVLKFLVIDNQRFRIYMLDSERGPVPHRGPISTTGANLIPHRGPIRGNVKILRDDVVRFTALPMMTLKINVIIKMATSTEIDVLYRAVLNIKEMGLLLESKGTNFKYFHK